MVDVVSFDLFGTLVDRRPVDYFWLELIPRLYAEERGLGLEDAKKEVLSRYEDIGESDLRWYLPSYWIEELGLRASLGELLAEIEPMVEVSEEVSRVLSRLSARYRLVISTNSSVEFAEVALRALDPVGRVFERVYSCVSHLGIPKKTREFYEYVCADLGVEPRRVAHVGDDPVYDCAVPSSIGIRAYCLGSGDRAVRDLEEFARLVETLDC